MQETIAKKVEDAVEREHLRSDKNIASLETRLAWACNAQQQQQTADRMSLHILDTRKTHAQKETLATFAKYSLIQHNTAVTKEQLATLAPTGPPQNVSIEILRAGVNQPPAQGQLEGRSLNQKKLEHTPETQAPS
jgi:hypothetical protein